MPSRPAGVRLNDFYEVYERARPEAAQAEGARCMNCGAAFCMPDSGYGQGCPIHNKIPEWNELVRLGRWRDAYDRLSETNPFPEFTARVCPAPCQDACIVGINESPIEIKGIERSIIDRAFDEGWVTPPEPPERAAPTGRRVAIVGSGPAGLAAAERLARRGHAVTVYEKDDRPGGLLMYGVPNMKLDKGLVDRRIALLEQAGVRFEVGRELGKDLDPQRLRAESDALLLALGAQRARPLTIDGADLPGVVPAMDYLTHATRAQGKGRTTDRVPPEFDAAGKDVVVIGGGDTGADCVGTALRQGCRSLANITRRGKPPAGRGADHPWPGPAGAYTLDYAHLEGAARFGEDPRAFGLEPLSIERDPESGGVAGVRIRDRESGGERVVPAQMVVLAIGFVGHAAAEPASRLGLTTDHGVMRGDESGRTGRAGVYVAGDCRRGPSLVVWALREGMAAAESIHADLRADTHAKVRG
ncbi:MAG: glutamate synthase subunit beta [Planctomycetota bacterium]